MEEKVSKGLNKLAVIFEILLSIAILVGVLIGFKDVIKELILFAQDGITYESFKHFLSFVLMLVVGIEFVLMLLTHSIDRTIELVVFVITRKMLIYGSTMLDMVLGALAVGIIFGSIKYFTNIRPDIEPEEIE